MRSDPRPERPYFTLERLEQTIPSIRWRDPVMVHWEHASEGTREMYACRICIANFGLKSASEHQWPTFRECADHVLQEHQEPSGE